MPYFQKRGNRIRASDKLSVIDRTAIKDLVREIMRTEVRIPNEYSSVADVSQPNTPVKNIMTSRSYEREAEPTEKTVIDTPPEVDDMPRDLIFSTMAAFRKNG